MSESGLYRDPTFERVLSEEISEKGCAACTRSMEVFDGAFTCTVGKRFPRCRGERGGFNLDDGEAR